MFFRLYFVGLCGFAAQSNKKDRYFLAAAGENSRGGVSNHAGCASYEDYTIEAGTRLRTMRYTGASVLELQN
jgi:hypothetical protein